MKLYIIDYQKPKSEEIECLIVEAEDNSSAERKAIAELKDLGIPKRYLIRIEVF